MLDALALGEPFLDERLASAALALDLGVAVAALADYRRAARVPLRASRRWPPLLVQESPAEIEVSVGTAARRTVTLILREGLHPGLAAAPLRRELVVRGAEEVRWAYSLTPQRRGEHSAAPLTARVLGPWKLAWSQRDLLPAEPVCVSPIRARTRVTCTCSYVLVLVHGILIRLTPGRSMRIDRERRTS